MHVDDDDDLDARIMELVTSDHVRKRATALLSSGIGRRGTMSAERQSCSPLDSDLSEALHNAGYREVPLDATERSVHDQQWPLATDVESVASLLFQKAPAESVSANEIGVAESEVFRLYRQLRLQQPGLAPVSTRVFGVTVVFDPPLGNVCTYEFARGTVIVTDSIRSVYVSLQQKFAVDQVSYGRIWNDCTVTVTTDSIQVDGRTRDPVVGESFFMGFLGTSLMS